MFISDKAIGTKEIQKNNRVKPSETELAHSYPVLTTIPSLRFTFPLSPKSLRKKYKILSTKGLSLSGNVWKS